MSLANSKTNSDENVVFVTEQKLFEKANVLKAKKWMLTTKVEILI
jgi:hypothetical protein